MNEFCLGWFSHHPVILRSYHSQKPEFPCLGRIAEVDMGDRVTIVLKPNVNWKTYRVSERYKSRLSKRLKNIVDYVHVDHDILFSIPSSYVSLVEEVLCIEDL